MGNYIGTRSLTEDEMRNLFDKAKEPNTEEEFNFNKAKIKVRSNDKGDRVWQAYSLDGKTPIGGAIYYSLEQVLKELTTIETEVENNDFAE